MLDPLRRTRPTIFSFNLNKSIHPSGSDTPSRSPRSTSRIFDSERTPANEKVQTDLLPPQNGHPPPQAPAGLKSAAGEASGRARQTPGASSARSGPSLKRLRNSTGRAAGGERHGWLFFFALLQHEERLEFRGDRSVDPQQTQCEKKKKHRKKRKKKLNPLGAPLGCTYRGLRKTVALLEKTLNFA